MQSSKSVWVPTLWVFVLWSLFQSHLSVGQEKKTVVPRKAAATAPLHDSLVDQWKDQQDQLVKLDVTSPENRRYTYAITGPTREDRFAPALERALQPIFQQATAIKELNLEGITVAGDGNLLYNGQKYSIWFRTNGSNLAIESMNKMRASFAEQLTEIIRAPRLERFETYNRKTLYFGILLDREKTPNVEADDELIELVRELMTGNTVDQFEVSEAGELVFNKQVVTVHFYWGELNNATKKTELKYFTVPEMEELENKFRRHIRYVYDKRVEEVEKTPSKVTEFAVPELVEESAARPAIREGEAARDLVAGLPHFKRILAFLAKAHPDLHARLQKELSEQRDLRVEKLPVNSLKNTEKSFHFAHVIKHDGRRIVIAANKWAVLDKNRAEGDENVQLNRSYCMLYALLEGILPEGDTGRSAKAHELTMELVFLEQDKGSLEAIDSETLSKFVESFVTSSQTERLRAYVRDMRLLTERDNDYLDGLGQQGQDLREALALMQEIAEDEARRSLASDFREVLGKKTDETFEGSVHLALWRLFQSMQQDPRWAKEIYRKQDLLRETTSMVLRGEIESTEDLKKALLLLKESRKPNPQAPNEAPPVTERKPVTERPPVTEPGPVRESPPQSPMP